jgi:hypothetical protein
MNGYGKEKQDYNCETAACQRIPLFHEFFTSATIPAGVMPRAGTGRYDTIHGKRHNTVDK